MALNTGRSLIFKTLIILFALCMMMQVSDARRGSTTKTTYRKPVVRTTRVVRNTTVVRRTPVTRYVRVYHAPVGRIVVVPNMQPATYMCQQDLMSPYVY